MKNLLKKKSLQLFRNQIKYYSFQRNENLALFNACLIHANRQWENFENTNHLFEKAIHHAKVS